MNIFIMVLMFLFMAGYYFMDAPSNRNTKTELSHAISQSDLGSVMECVAAAHTAAIRDYEFNDICTTQYNITSSRFCINEKSGIIKCEIIKKKKPFASFILTAGMPINNSDYNNMLEILEKKYPGATSFGIFNDDVILSGGGNGKRGVPAAIIAAAKLANGQLVYMTQYEIPDTEIEYAPIAVNDIKCPTGTTKIYRFARYICVPQNEKITCGGDTVWDSDLMECVSDNTRRPLCDSRQTAVMIDDNWECIDPFLDKNCPGNMIARLNYNTLTWECIDNAETIVNTKKCANTNRAIGTPGATLRVPVSACNDCETTIIDDKTCAVSCVPNPDKLGDSKCYPNARDCAGTSRAFYFGFPNIDYARGVSVLGDTEIPIDASHSQNRRFNCLDCGTGRVDTDKSLPPYIAVCE